VQIVKKIALDTVVAVLTPGNNLLVLPFVNFNENRPGSCCYLILLHHFLFLTNGMACCLTTSPVIRDDFLAF
jgi:hypothetical protein